MVQRLQAAPQRPRLVARNDDDGYPGRIGLYLRDEWFFHIAKPKKGALPNESAKGNGW